MTPNYPLSPRCSLWLLHKLAALCILSLFIGPALQAVEDVEAWRQDLALYRTELPARHKNLFFHTTSNEFNRQLDVLEADLASLSDLEASLLLERITIAIGDDHTSIALPRKLIEDLDRLPLSVGWFEDGLHILSVPEKFKPALGARIVSSELPPSTRPWPSLRR